MSLPIDNLDMLEELVTYIKNPDVDLQAVVKEYSGMTYYIPSYKTTFRNDEIINEYKENYGKVGIVRKLAKEYHLSERQVYDITKEVRENF